MNVWMLMLLSMIQGCLAKTDKAIRDCIVDVGSGTTAA